MYLVSATSEVMMPGRRSTFLGMLPISPSAVGLAKHAVLMSNGKPLEEKEPLGTLLGSHTRLGRALTEPPVKSVIAGNPVAVTVPELYVTFVKSTTAGLPLTSDEMPETCQPP